MRRSKLVDPKGDRRGTGKGLLIVDDLVDTGKTGG
jgi:hypoxanthine phosphoribosyltransferase